jgi:hypothetical protein
MKPDCIHCSRHLRLVSEDNYSWQCEAGCAERIDTGIPTSTSITSFQRYAIPQRRGRHLTSHSPASPGVCFRRSGLYATDYLSFYRVHLGRLLQSPLPELYRPVSRFPCGCRLRSAQPGRPRICRRNTWLDRRTHLRRALLPSPQCELPEDCRLPSGYIR